MKTFSLIFLTFFSVLTSTGQVGAFDTTFGVNGSAITYFGSTLLDYFTITESVKLSDGKIVGLYSGNGYVFLKRFNTDGSLDTTFGNNGGIMTYMPSYNITAVQIVLQTDGKLVVGGTTNVIATKVFLLRYNPDGSIDTTFGTNGLALIPVFNWELYNFAILPDNSFIISNGNYNNSALFSIAKVTTNGSLDPSFGTNGIVSISILNHPNDINEVRLLSVQPDGKIIATGTAQALPSPKQFCSVRYLPNCNAYYLCNESF
jgi:uncharacterized delta-60 repeat protein